MIKACELRCRYPGQQRDALRGVSFSVSPGSVTLFSGPTGSGKSTLGLMLCGVIPHLLSARIDGRIGIDGKDPSAVAVSDLSRTVGYLMQNVELQVFTDTVEEEVAFGLENFAVPEDEMNERIRCALERVGAAHLLHRPMAVLSSGERQRVMLAALLCLDQPVLILDEPLAFLDREACRRLLSMIRSLSLAGKAVVIFEHRRGLVLPMADREICFQDGCLVPEPPPQASFPTIGGSSLTGLVLLEASGLSITPPGADSALFSRASFEIRAGESLVLLGKNGGGKTTLLKLLVGLLKPGEGRVIKNGRPLPALKAPRKARNTFYVFQNPDHQLHLPTVEEQVAWQCNDRAVVRREIDELGLRGLERRHPRSLSTGQRRRVTLAAALAAKPDLLLLDEPTVGQDDESLRLILHRLDRFLQEGGAILAATHDERAAKSMARRVLWIKEGGIDVGGKELIDGFFDEDPGPARSFGL